MNAGRELDALVAEKVMGWQWSPHFGAFYPPGLHPMNNIYGHIVPKYSTSIEAAWQVVEKLSELGMSVQVSLQVGRPYCCLAIQKDGRVIGECAETAPLAICLAALKAVGHEVAV